VKKNQRNGAKAEPTVSPVWIMGSLVSKEAGMTKGLTGVAPDALLKKEPRKIKGMDGHRIPGRRENRDLPHIILEMRTMHH
jgi:hypothetical protein